MIIKKYILTSGKDIIDVEASGGIAYYYHEGNVVSVAAGHCGDEYFKNDIQTSNDMLDLIESNDLIELEGDIVHIHDIDTETGNFILVDGRIILRDRYAKKITAIYKRQFNGDYRRFEIDHMTFSNVLR